MKSTEKTIRLSKNVQCKFELDKEEGEIAIYQVRLMSIPADDLAGAVVGICLSTKQRKK